MKTITVPIAPGELLDKLTILQLKLDNIADPAKTKNADETLPKSGALDALVAQLRQINSDLWEIEDNIREMEAAKDFGAGFIALARSVYITNDERAAVKKQINLLLGSDLVEEKSYKGGTAA